MPSVSTACAVVSYFCFVFGFPLPAHLFLILFLFLFFHCLRTCFFFCFFIWFPTACALVSFFVSFFGFPMPAQMFLFCLFVCFSTACATVSFLCLSLVFHCLRTCFSSFFQYWTEGAHTTHAFVSFPFLLHHLWPSLLAFPLFGTTIGTASCSLCFYMLHLHCFFSFLVLQCTHVRVSDDFLPALGRADRGGGVWNLTNSLCMIMNLYLHWGGLTEGEVCGV